MEPATIALGLSVLSALFGGGALIKIFMVGREWGALREKLKRYDDIDIRVSRELGPSVTKLEGLINTFTAGLSDNVKELKRVQESLSASQSKLHGRIDDLSQRTNEDIRKLSTEAASYTNGMKTITTQIGEMLKEINNFLKSEATQRTHSHRLDVLETDLKRVMGELAALQGKFSMLSKGGGNDA